MCLHRGARSGSHAKRVTALGAHNFLFEQAIYNKRNDENELFNIMCYTLVRAKCTQMGDQNNALHHPLLQSYYHDGQLVAAVRKLGPQHRVSVRLGEGGRHQGPTVLHQVSNWGNAVRMDLLGINHTFP